MAVRLKRDARPLLKTVEGKQHAKPEDHERFPTSKPKRRCTENAIKSNKLSIDDVSPRTSQVSSSTNTHKVVERLSASPISSDTESGNNDMSTHSSSTSSPLRTESGLSDFSQTKVGKKGRHHGTTYGTNKRFVPPPQSKAKDWTSGYDNDKSSPVWNLKKSSQPRKTYGSGFKNVHAVGRPHAAVEDNTPDSSFKKPPHSQLSGSAQKKSTRFKIPSEGNIRHNQRRSDSESGSEEEDDDDDELPNDKLVREARGLPLKKTKRITKKNAAGGSAFKDPTARFGSNAPSSSLTSQNTFKTPLRASIDGSDSSMSSPPDSIVLDDEEEVLDLPLTSSQVEAYNGEQTTCPMCSAVIPAEFLDEFANYSRRMPIKRQVLFCKAHKRRSALEEYRASGYPEVDWNELPQRIKRHYSYIDAILDQQRDSWFREELVKRVRRGGARTLRQAVDKKDDETSLAHLVPGYYGTKGARVMTESIFSRFSAKMKELAARDDVLSLGGGGVAGFVQTVLVPELATILIKEDMHVDDMEARDLMVKSAAIGRLVHEEEDEKVIVPDDALLQHVNLDAELGLTERHESVVIDDD
ncbi:MAG: hypothetical protein M1820_008482 [Bogoriella megaspora]|nr:MAG: hypothetical protein M1820_008482 [Bogoriella megaspora]